MLRTFIIAGVATVFLSTSAYAQLAGPRTPSTARGRDPVRATVHWRDRDFQEPLHQRAVTDAQRERQSGRYRTDREFSEFWRDAEFARPEPQRNQYADSMYYYSDRFPIPNDEKYGNDPDWDGYGDDNQYNNDSEYVSPKERFYRGNRGPLFFGARRYDERERGWDDRTSGAIPSTIGSHHISGWY